MQTVQAGGVRLAVEVRGQGPAVLLVHGFPLDHTLWNAQIESLAERYRVLVPDLRGFGHSGPAEDTVTMEQFADDLAGLLDALGIDGPIVLGGLSMGGYIAMAFLRKYPQRLRGLALCDTKAAADSDEAKAGRLATAERVLREGPEFLAQTMLPKLLAPASLEKKDLVDRVRRMIVAQPPAAIAAAQRGMAQRPDSTDLLGRLPCPALFLAGEHDALSPPADMRQLAAACRTANGRPGTFVEISGAGHLAPLENPAEVNAALHSFLE